MRAALLIFDFDGTLADTFEDVVASMAATFAARGHRSPDRAAIRRNMGLPLEDAIPLMGGPSQPAELQRWVQAYRHHYREGDGRRTSLFPGARRVLQTAISNGRRPVLVSNKGIGAIQSILAREHIAEYFQAVFAAGASRFLKPDPRLYSVEIKGRFPGAGDEDSLVVGDTETDLAFAKNAGIRSCWAMYGYGNAQECRAMRPDIVIESLDALPEALV